MIRLAVRCRPEQADLVLAELAVLAPNGFEEEHGDGYVEYAIYGAEGELPELGELRGGGRARGWSRSTRPRSPTTGPTAGRTSTSRCWSAGGSGCAPPWEPARADAVDVVVDPGRAFGTGAHPTTRLCLELLIELAAAGSATGPLPTSAPGPACWRSPPPSSAGTPVRACDHEPASLGARRGPTPRQNGVELQLDRVNLRKELPPLPPTAVANLTAPLLAHVAAGIRGGEPPQSLVCSGLLATEADAVAAGFAAAGLERPERRVDGDWAALRLGAGFVSDASDSKLPIAIFDSGVGGLTVLHECLVSLPAEDFLYLGDSAQFPYGAKSAEELRACVEQVSGFLLDRGAKLLVVACNSAASAGLETPARGWPPPSAVSRSSP